MSGRDRVARFAARRGPVSRRERSRPPFFVAGVVARHAGVGQDRRGPGGGTGRGRRRRGPGSSRAGSRAGRPSRGGRAGHGGGLLAEEGAAGTAGRRCGRRKATGGDAPHLGASPPAVQGVGVRRRRSDRPARRDGPDDRDQDARAEERHERCCRGTRCSPTAKNEKRNPPTIAPMRPTMMSPMMPKPPPRMTLPGHRPGDQADDQPRDDAARIHREFAKSAMIKSPERWVVGVTPKHRPLRGGRAVPDGMIQLQSPRRFWRASRIRAVHPSASVRSGPSSRRPSPYVHCFAGL